METKRNATKLGEVIKETRRGKGIAIADFADSTYIDSKRIVQIEMGDCRPNDNELTRISKVLNLPYNELFELRAPLCDDDYRDKAVSTIAYIIDQLDDARKIDKIVKAALSISRED